MRPVKESELMTRQRSDEWRKQQIRAAATRCFVRRGFAATRLFDIAQEAGLSKGGVYFHYRAKEALFHDILESHIKSLEARWSFEPLSGQPADETLYRLVLAHLRTLEDEADETRLLHLLVSMTPQDPAFRVKLEEAVGVLRTLYAQAIERGIEAGVFPKGDAPALANAVLGLIEGLAVQSAADVAGQLPLRPEMAAGFIVGALKSDAARLLTSTSAPPPPARPDGAAAGSVLPVVEGTHLLSEP